MLDITVKPRSFLPQDFKVTDWEFLKPYADNLVGRDISTRAAFDRFLLDESEFSAVTQEDRWWRYIRTTTHTNDESIQQSYNHFITTIEPQLTEWANVINQKILVSPFIDKPLNDAEALLFKCLKNDAAMFRTENIPLGTEISQLEMDVDAIRGAMSVELDGETLTMPQAAQRFLWPDRAKREEAWRAVANRRIQDKNSFDNLMDQMIKKRHQIALNAGYRNFRDYQHHAYRRFDYTPEDCYKFHAAVEQHILPILGRLNEKRRKRMNLETLRPWDTGADPFGRPALKAFDNVNEMVDKSIAMLDRVDPFFGGVVRAQRAAGRLDLESRPHKRPGAYNCPLSETFVPFMFANATSTADDIVTLVHEAGHATHDLLSYTLPLQAYKIYPMEFGEVASMTMELFVFDKWDIFFSDKNDCTRAQEEFLQQALSIFPWYAQIDLFQHELYLNPEWTPEQRHDAWFRIVKRFMPPGLDLSGLDLEYRLLWHKQGHVFDLPFYYIEYAIAQLGALQIWQNYKADPRQAVEQYKAALALGYTKPLPELFTTAGIKFDFSPEAIAELVPFVVEQLEALGD